jgi:hypothetical protein
MDLFLLDDVLEDLHTDAITVFTAYQSKLVVSIESIVFQIPKQNRGKKSYRQAGL